jgi:hypothetical protein
VPQTSGGNVFARIDVVDPRHEIGHGFLEHVGPNIDMHIEPLPVSPFDKYPHLAMTIRVENNSPLASGMLASHLPKSYDSCIFLC